MRQKIWKRLAAGALSAVILAGAFADNVWAEGTGESAESTSAQGETLYGSAETVTLSSGMAE